MKRTLFLCLLLAAGAVCFPADAVRAAEPDRPVVRTVTPRRAPEKQTYSVPGRTEPLESARIFTRATGIIAERRFDIGDVVKAGEVLAVIEAPDVDRAVDAARAVVEQMKARAANARVLAERSTSLLAANAVSREQAEEQQTAAAEAVAGVRAAEAELARLEERQKFSVVRAPFDAVISARNADRGDRVQGDAAPAEGWLYRIARLDVLRFAVAAPPDLALRVEPGQKARIRFNEFPGQTFEAVVARTSRSFETTTGTMRIELELQNRELTIPAGLTGTASFEVVPAGNTVLIPTNTLLTREGRDYVAAVQDGRVQFLDVAAGRNLGNLVEVRSDELTPETAIIVNPNALLRAGDAVAVGEPPPKA